MSKNAWAKLRGPNTRMLKVCLGWLKTELKANRASEIEEQRKERPENKKTKPVRQRLATLKRLKRGDDNEFERNLRLEKVVYRKVLKLAGDRRTKKAKHDWRRW